MKIWVISEQPELLAEMLSGIKEICSDVSINAVSLGSKKGANTAFALGADKSYLVRYEEGIPVEAAYACCARVIREEGGDFVLVAASKRGQTFAALLAAELDSSMVTEAKIDAITAESIKTTRYIYGGLAVSADTLVSGISVVSIPPHTWKSPVLENVDSGLAEVIEIVCEASRVKVVEQRIRESNSVNLEEAEVIVTIGRGVKKREDLAMFEELANLFGGVVACTRPLAEEEGYLWFPEDLYIGISGRHVKPNLYILVGSSGQIQHIAGCRDAKIFVGINNDENAPVFESSDYGIVGDLYDVIPELIEQIKAKR